MHSCRLSCLAMESGLLPGADGGFCEKLLDFQLSFALLPICRFGFQDYFSGRFGPEFSLTHLRFRAWIAENCFTWNICFYITVQNRVGFHIYSDIFRLFVMLFLIAILAIFRLAVLVAEHPYETELSLKTCVWMRQMRFLACFIPLCHVSSTWASGKSQRARKII